MKTTGRIKNVLKNSIVGIFVQITSIILNFVGRIIFLQYLSTEYLGINGLFSNVLTMLSLAELGVGTAITYSLYKPLSNNNEIEISRYMNFYKKTYNCIGIIITIVGIILVPFIPHLINESTNINNISFYYILFLLNTSCSYFFAYKKSLYIANQKEYVVSKIRLIFSFAKIFFQSVFLIIFKNFTIYLIIQIMSTLSENLYLSYKANKDYKFLKYNKEYQLDILQRKKLFSDIKSLMVYKIGSTILDGTDNILLSVFVGVNWVGKLSNYTLVINSISMILSQINSALTASIGNFIAKESKDKYENLLYNITFVNYIFYSIFFVGCTCLLNPFVELVFGEKYLLDNMTIFVLSLNFYIFGMMNSIWTFRTTMGLFVHGKYRPLVSAIMNIVVSIILVLYIGPIGVLLGTTITRVLTNVWFDPYIVFKYGINKSALKYYKKWLTYLIISIMNILIIKLILNYILLNNFITFIIKGCICVLTTLTINYMFFSTSSECKYLLSILKK